MSVIVFEILKMETPGKYTVIELVYTESHCIYYVPENFEQILTEAQDKFAIEEHLYFYYNDFDGDKVMIKNDNDLNKSLRYCDKNSISLLKLYILIDNQQQNKFQEDISNSNQLVHRPNENFEISGKDKVNDVYVGKEGDNVLLDNYFKNSFESKLVQYGDPKLDGLVNDAKSDEQDMQMDDISTENITNSVNISNTCNASSTKKSLKIIMNENSNVYKNDAINVLDLEISKPASFKILDRIAKDVKQKSGLMSSVTSFFKFMESAKDFEDMLVVDNIPCSS